MTKPPAQFALRRFSLFLAVVMGLSVLAVTPAEAGFRKAGFKWLAPTGDQLPGPVVIGDEPPSVLVAPMDRNASANAAPPALVIEGNDRSDLPAVSTMAMGRNDSGMLEGFADNVPLRVALRQVVPASYAVATDPGVDMGALVSWRGGKSWQDVLQSMLATIGLDSRVDGQTVRIGAGGRVMAAPSAMAETLPPVSAPVETAPMDNLPSPEATAPVATAMPMIEPMASPAPMTSVAESWVAERGTNLRDVISAWAQRAGVEVVWSAEYDYPLQSTLTFTGSFEDAVRGALLAFSRAKPRPFGKLHNNPAVGQRVLIISAVGNNYGE